MKKNGNAGFTIVEMLIAISISSIVLLGVFTLTNSQAKLKKTHDQVIEAQQNIRSAMFMLERDLRIAGYKGNTMGITAGFIATCDADTLTFNYVSDDDAGTVSTIQYDLVDFDGDGSSETLVRSLDGAQDTIAEDIENIEFLYTLDDGSTATAPADPSLIRSVTVSLLVRSRKPVNVDTSGHSYTTASGVTWDGYNDNLFRRFAQSQVICRNLIGI